MKRVTQGLRPKKEEQTYEENLKDGRKKTASRSGKYFNRKF
jgi:hypothetical protein